MAPLTQRGAAALALSALLAACGCHHQKDTEVAGVYVASDFNAVLCMRLEHAADNKLTGKAYLAFRAPSGRFEQEGTDINGTLQGENITLTTGPLPGGAPPRTVTGTFDGKLSLKGILPLPVTFEKTTKPACQAKMKSLSRHLF